MEMKRIYIADDEPHIREILRSFLEQGGYSVASFSGGAELLAAQREAPADLVIVDIMMPPPDGMALCRTLRMESAVPLIFISALDSEQDKIDGLTLGGDDYLTKPFSPLELVARVNGLFRRMAMNRNSEDSPQELAVGKLRLSQDTLQGVVGSRPLSLTGMEFSLLWYLARNRHRAVGREELLEKVWCFKTHVETRATDDVVKRLRKKLEQADSQIRIETVWGFGFRLTEG